MAVILNFRKKILMAEWCCYSTDDNIQITKYISEIHSVWYDVLCNILFNYGYFETTVYQEKCYQIYSQELVPVFKPKRERKGCNYKKVYPAENHLVYITSHFWKCAICWVWRDSIMKKLLYTLIIAGKHLRFWFKTKI